MKARSLWSIAVLVLALAGGGFLGCGLYTDASMRTASRHQTPAQAAVVAEMPGFVIEGGTDTPISLVRSRHRIIGVLDGEAIEVEVHVLRGKATIVSTKPYIE